MRERVISPLTYVVVWVFLIIFTVLTVGLSFLHVEAFGHLVIGLSIGLVKATLVVLFFMHAAISPRLTWIVIAVVVFWFGILLVLTLNDYLSRGLIPTAPGH